MIQVKSEEHANAVTLRSRKTLVEPLSTIVDEKKGTFQAPAESILAEEEEESRRKWRKPHLDHSNCLFYSHKECLK